MEEKNVPMIEQHKAETTFMHLSWANRRMLIALVCICITMISVVIVFATNQTKREQMWQETIKSMYHCTVPEATDGQQNTDP